MTPDYVVLHTAAADIPNVDAARIDEWHRARGWAGIGYHWVVINDRHDTKADGTIERGRDETALGAHARGLNARSIGICLAGHGDRRPMTEGQKLSLLELVLAVLRRHNLQTARLIGHRELNVLVEDGDLAPQYATRKTCPGRFVDMDEVRRDVARELGEEQLLTISPAAVRAALRTMESYVRRTPNAADEWRAFRYHPEIVSLLEGP